MHHLVCFCYDGLEPFLGDMFEPRQPYGPLDALYVKDDPTIWLQASLDKEFVTNEPVHTNGLPLFYSVSGIIDYNNIDIHFTECIEWIIIIADEWKHYPRISIIIDPHRSWVKYSHCVK